MKKFKKILTLLWIMTSKLILPACNQEEEIGFWNLYDQSDIEFEVLYEQFRELLLEDFDILTNKLQTYSPHFGVIYRRHRVDMNELIIRQRSSIENERLFLRGTREPTIERLPRQVANGFLHQLWSLSHGIQLAHIMPSDRDLIQRSYFFCLTYFEEEDWCQMFAHPSIRAFYQLDSVDETTHQENPMMQWDENNVRTEIIIPGEVAYVSFNHFFNASPEHLLFEENILFPFYYEIQDFSHLVFDFRGNRGGFSDPFFDLIVGPFVNYPLEAQIHQFFRANIFSYIDNYTGTFHIGIIEIDESEIISALDFINERGMMYFNTDDMTMLDYVVVIQMTIEPVEVDFYFHGKIWILVDGLTASAGELAVLFAMDSGFATVVGTNTMGVMPSATAQVLLPNTGIIFRFDVGYFTDACGRSLEEFGITPDYLNRPEMDALETVLAMIEEMNH